MEAVIGEGQEPGFIEVIAQRWQREDDRATISLQTTD